MVSILIDRHHQGVRRCLVKVAEFSDFNEAPMNSLMMIY